jgi:hypothetical protein
MSTIEGGLKPADIRELRERLEALRRDLAADYDRHLDRERAIPVDEAGDLADRAAHQEELEAAPDLGSQEATADRRLPLVRLTSNPEALTMPEPASLEQTTEASTRPLGKDGGGPAAATGASGSPPPRNSLQETRPAAAPEHWQRRHPEYFLG